MRMLVALTIALSVFDGSFAQAPCDADPFCTEVLPGVGVNILDYAPEVKPLMDSRHYQNLLPPHDDAVWQEVDNGNNNPSGTTTDWLQNTNTICRQSVFVCGFQAGGQITRPEIIAPIIGNSPPIQVDGQCVENSSPENGMRPRLTCSQNGVWGGFDGAGCVCDTEFQRSLDGRSCVEGCDSGMYLSINITCLPCPANSNSTQRGLSQCPCFAGYFRADGEPPERECTQPPSAPRNLIVLQVTNTSVQLSWNPPVSNGGRDDLEYQLSYTRAGVPDNVTVYGRVNVTVGQIIGLRPFTQYVVMVSGENGVSAQDTDISGRTVNATITTEEGVPPAITLETIQVNEFSDIITWQPPTEPNGEILHYNIRIYRVDGDRNEELVDTVSEVQATTFDFSTRGLSSGTYNIQIQAVTRVGVGEFSQSIPLTIEDSESPAAVIVAAIIPSIVAVIAITLFGVVLCSYIRLRMKQDARQDTVEASDYPEYAVVEQNLAGIETRQNVAYETGIQAVATESNIAYQVVMQGHSPEQHNTSV